MDRPIAPLFNISKRPRQAVVSDPFDSQSSAPKQPLSNTGYVGNSHQRPGPQLGNQSKSRPVNNQMNLLPPKPALPQYNTKRAPHPGPYGDGPSAGMKQSKGNHSRPYGDGQSGFKQSKGNNSSPYGDGPSIMKQSWGNNSFNSAQQKPSNNGGQIQRNQSFQNNNKSQRATCGYSGTNKQVIKSGQSVSSGNNYQRNIGMNHGMNNHQPTFKNRQTFSNNNPPVSTNMDLPSALPGSSGSTFNTQAYNRAQLQTSAAKFNPQPSTSFAATPTKPVPKYGSTKSSADKSLRVFTASVQAAQQWGNSKHAIPALFELYGVVDSAITMNHFIQGKQFLLKDETGIIQCIFFEIDRGLQRLTRGQWHRCMGAFDPKLEKFKCVSVRPSSLSDRSLAKLSIKTSEEAMTTLIRELRES